MFIYQSNIPAPSLDEIKMNLNNTAKQLSYRKTYSWIKNDEINKIIDDLLEPHCSDNQLDYSYAAWHLSLKNDVEIILLDKCSLIINNRRIKRMRQLKALFKLTFILISLHNRAKERIYHPDSLFVNNVLKNHFNNLCIKL